MIQEVLAIVIIHLENVGKGEDGPAQEDEREENDSSLTKGESESTYLEFWKKNCENILSETMIHIIFDKLFHLL